MRIKRIFETLEAIYSVLILLVVGLYVLWIEFDASFGAPPAWLCTAVWAVLIPAAVLLLKEGVSLIVGLLKAGDPDA